MAKSAQDVFRIVLHGVIVAGMISTTVIAQDKRALAGQPSKIQFSIPNVGTSSKCNIEVLLPNQQKIDTEVLGPDFIASVEYTPIQAGTDILRWEGKFKPRGLYTVFGCPGSGTVEVNVTGNSDQIAQKWNEYFARVPEEIRDCVKVGMDLSQLKYQVLADPTVTLTSSQDLKLKPIYEKCESFVKQNQPRKGTPCTLANLNNLRTTCDGVYAERQPDGRLKTISRTAAIQLQFEGKPWTIGVLENSDVRVARLKQEEEDKAKQAANIAAQKEAEEKERKFKESPEYKKQQAELERKRIVDEKEAALAAKKAQEEAERQKVANARAEQERIQKQEAASKAQREQEEKQRLEYAKDFPYYAVINCGANYGGYPFYLCFAGSGRSSVDTELEIRNGSAYKMYKYVDMMQLQSRSNDLVIDLRNKFEIVAQNSSDTFILNVKVYNRATKQVVFEKSAARFGAIRVSN